MPYQVIKNLNFCYAHRLLHYEGKCSNLHGHNALVQIVLSKDQLDHRGILIDFEEIKIKIQKFLDENLDHQTILWSDDPLLKDLILHKQKCFVMNENPTAENLAKIIFEEAKKQQLPIQAVHFWETPSACAIYEENRP